MKNQEIDRFEYNRKVAQIKYGLIAPILSNTYIDENQSAYFQRISKLEIEMPDGTKKRFSPETIKNWLHKYRHYGLEGIQTNIRLDLGVSRSLNDGSKERIKELINEFPKITGVMIREKLIKEGIITESDVSVDTIQRYIRNNELRLKNGEGIKKERRTWEYAHSCDGYEADTCHTMYIFDEFGEYKKTYLIAMIDSHSRLIVGARFFFNDTAVNFQTVWKEAVIRYGRSKVMILDNGSSYKNKSNQLISSKLGTHLIYNPPYSPTGKAIVERFFLTIKQRWLHVDHGKNYHSLEQLNGQLFKRIAEYNNTPHSALDVNGTSDHHKPLQRYMYDMKDKEPWKLVNKHQVEYDGWVDECFLHEETRKVNGDSTVKINHILFDVPSKYIGTSIMIRYDPLTYETIYLYDPVSKQKITLKETDKIENGKTRREEILY